MKIVAIGIDDKVFEKSRVFERQLEYSSLCEEYHSLVLTNKFCLKIAEGNFQAIPVNFKFKILSFFSLFRQVKELKLDNKEVVLSAQDPFEIGLMVFILSRFFNYKFHVQIHTDIGSKYFRYESFRNFTQWLIFRFVVNRADANRVVSNRIKKYLISLGIDSEKIFVAPIYAGDVLKKVEDGRQKGEAFLPLTERQNEILILSRIEKVKNIPLAIEAFKILQKNKKYENFILKIVGDGTQKKYLQEKYKNVQNLFWKGWSKNPEENFGSAKIFLLTSRYEGWGMTPIEAVSCGTPVVMTDVGCANEFIFDNLNGKICPKNTPKSVASSIEQVLKKLADFDQNKLQNSLKMLQNKEQYHQMLVNSWAQALK